MKLSQKKLVKRLLLATVAATSLVYFGGVCNIVHADAEFEHPDNPSNNTITVNADNYTINGTTISYWGWFGQSFSSLYAGYSNSGDVSGNTFTFNAGNIRGLNGIYGGYSNSGNVFNNVMNFNGGTFNANVILGGYAYSGNVTGNTVNISSGVTFSNIGTTAPVVYGGETFNGNAEGNTVNISGGTIGAVTGGFATNDANNNAVNINGGEITGGTAYDFFGTGATYSGNVIGGVGNGEASGNTVNISGGTINGNIVAALGVNGRNNFINIWGNPTLNSVTLIGGNALQSGNTLNIATSLTAQNIENFNALNFFIPKSLTNGGTMLTLTDTSGTNLSGTAIRAAIQGGSTLDTGDTVTLIQSAGTITTDSSTTYGKMSQAEYDAIKGRLPSGMLSDGVSLNYDMTVEKSGDNTIIARIGNTTTDDTTPTDSATDTTTPTDSATDTTTTTNSATNTTTPTDSTTDTTTPTDSATDTTTPTDSATATTTIPAPITNGNGVNTNRGGHTLPQTELLGGAQIASLKLVDFMSDKLVDWLPPCTFDFEDEMEDEVNLPDVPLKEPKGYEVFITGSGGSFRTKTGNGSYIESTLKGFDVGFGRSIDYSNGRLVFAPIFEYATGDYDSYLDDGMHGKGNTKYMAGGLIGRKSFKSGFYVEASARGGKTERDFSSDTMTSNGSPIFVHYDKTSAPVFAGHLRLGRQLRLNKNNLLDYYGIYFHSHQGGMNLHLSTGENYHFSSATSSRTRLGYRLTTRTSKISRIYTGLAFQYEHNPNVVGTYKGRRTPNAGSCGASGMLEFGWMIRPNKDNPWMLDLNATGFVGLQRGLSGTIKLQKEF